MPIWSAYAGDLFTHATEAHNRSALVSDKETPEALTAVLFSVVALESFINELVDLASGIGDDEDPPEPRFLALADVMEEIDHASLASKFLMAKWFLSGKSYDKSKAPYQDFAALIKVRNGLVHLKAEQYWPGESGLLVSSMGEAVLRSLESRRLIEPSPPANPGWLNRISTPAVARWACNTTAAMVHSILDTLADHHGCATCGFLRTVYGEKFTPIP